MLKIEIEGRGWAREGGREERGVKKGRGIISVIIFGIYLFDTNWVQLIQGSRLSANQYRHTVISMKNSSLLFVFCLKMGVFKKQNKGYMERLECSWSNLVKNRKEER